jgi:methionyl-tRNA formyltransferase
MSAGADDRASTAVAAEADEPGIDGRRPMGVAIAGRGWMAVRAARLVAALVTAEAVNARIEVVRNRNDPGKDSWLPSLVALAAARGWPVYDRAEQASLGAGDVLLSLQHDRIVDCAALGGAAAYNLHFAYLPRYRGSLTSALPIRHGDSQVGVTLHVLVPEVDAGPVIATQAFELPPFCTAYELYQLYHAYGFELLKENLQSLLHGEVVAVPQNDAAATTFYRSAIDFADADLADFDRTAAEVRDWTRSLIFPPSQLPTFRGRKVRGCYTLTCSSAKAEPPGTVIHLDPELAIVACRQDLVCLEFRQADGVLVAPDERLGW